MPDDMDVDDAYRRGYHIGARTSDITLQILNERLLIVLTAIEMALSDDSNTYGERCDIALELIQKSRPEAPSLSSQEGKTQ